MIVLPDHLRRQVRFLEEYELYNIAEDEDIDVKEYNLHYLKGLYNDNLIILRQGLTSAEVKCVLAEELGHYFYTVGNIIDQSKIENIKQENTARRWAYNKLVPVEEIHKLVPVEEIHKVVKSGYSELYEIADNLQVTEEFLRDALEEYILKNKIKEKENVQEEA